MNDACAIPANPAPASHAFSIEMHFHLPIANMAVLRSRTPTPFDMTPVRHAAPDPARFAAAPGTCGARRRTDRPCHP
ncbi:Protein of unassigned function [Burkholderia ambifaria]